MIKIEKIIFPSPLEYQAVIRGMRNPKNSWDKSDTNQVDEIGRIIIGENDLELMSRLASAGSVHGKFRRMLNVYMDITAPLYWWKEFDTYKVGTVANSCSTMHKIQAKEFEPIDFSWEKVDKKINGGVCDVILASLNNARECYLDAVRDNEPEWAKHYWWQMIQLLPSAYNQKRTVMMSYEVLTNIYEYRKNHKLDEWQDFCKVIETFPLFNEVITHR